MTRYRLYRIEECEPCRACDWTGTNEVRTEVVVEPDDALCGEDTITVYLEMAP